MALRKIGFNKFEYDVQIKVERTNPDGGEPLGLSDQSLNNFIGAIIESVKCAALEALAEGCNPRCIEFQGVYTITGVEFKKKEPT